MLRIPAGHTCTAHSQAVYTLNSGWDRTGLPSIDGSLYPGLHGCALVPFARTVVLVYQYPLIHQLHFQTIGVQLGGSPSMLAHVPWFSLLEALTIRALFAPVTGEAVTVPLLSILARMPRLRRLNVSAPDGQAHIDPATQGMRLPVLPCILEVVILYGRRSAATFEHIIAQSRRTLRELKINFLGRTDTEEALLVSALTHAAPSLRDLHLHLRGDTRPLLSLRPVFAALTRVDSLHLETPRSATLEETLDLLHNAPVRELTLLRLHCVPPSAHVDLCRLHMPCLRSLVLVDFRADDEGTRALVAYWNARRVRCHVEQAQFPGMDGM